MRILIQRVTSASVTVAGKSVASIGEGVLLFVGFRDTDTEDELRWMANKIPSVRLFQDQFGKMNRSLEEMGGSVLVVSQFTLYGELRKGNRPDFMAAAKPESAKELYDRFVKLLRVSLNDDRVKEGVFQAHMHVELVNDGPVTLMLERESNREIRKTSLVENEN